MRPRSVEPVLMAIDKRLEEAGATRGRKSLGDQVKSTIRFFGTDPVIGRAIAMAGAYVLDTCEIVNSNDSIKVLGGTLGSKDEVDKHFKKLSHCTRPLTRSEIPQPNFFWKVRAATFRRLPISCG